MEKYIAQVCQQILKGGIVKATKFISKNQIVRATLTLTERRLPRKNENIEITLTIGRPNYMEKEMIDGVPLPQSIVVKPYRSPKKK